MIFVDSFKQTPYLWNILQLNVTLIITFNSNLTQTIDLADLVETVL